MSDLDSALAPPVYDRHRSEAGTAEPPKSSGGADSGSVPSPSLVAGAASRVLRRVEHADNGCLIWRGAFNSAGTAVVSVGRRIVAISRVMWCATYGDYPTEKLERSCGDTRCVNVEHLRPQTTWADEDKFWSRVDVLGPLHRYDPELGRCWDWTGPRYPSGYGHVGGRADGYAHRHSFLLSNGRSPSPGMYVTHSCDRPCCVNPRHLREGSPTDNAAERDERFYGRKKVS